MKNRKIDTDSSKALLWDFDGTIIHPNDSFFDAMRVSLEGAGYEVSPQRIRAALQSASSWWNPENTYVNKTGGEWWVSFFGRFDRFYEEYGIGRSERSIINGCFKVRILDPVNYTVFEDAERVLARCVENGCKNYILSNNYPELQSVIAALGLAPYFTDYIVSSNVGYEKPRIELFQYARDIAGRPKDCYMIGDNPTADIQGGKSAGMRTVLVHQESESEADFHCENLSDVLEYIELS